VSFAAIEIDVAGDSPHPRLEHGENLIPRPFARQLIHADAIAWLQAGTLYLRHRAAPLVFVATAVAAVMSRPKFGSTALTRHRLSARIASPQVVQSWFS
jgi:hypothetical protein